MEVIILGYSYMYMLMQAIATMYFGFLTDLITQLPKSL